MNEKLDNTHEQKEGNIYLIGKLSSGENIYNTSNNHIHYNVEMESLLPQALEKINSLNRDFFVESIDFGKIIGESRCVETSEKDEILYAQRKMRSGQTRFVKNKQLEPTSFLTVILKKIHGGYKIVSAFIGSKAEREPWDKSIRDNDELERSKSFWSTHAIVWGTERIIPGTETNKDQI